MESHGSALVKENSIAGLCLGSGNPQNSRVRFTICIYIYIYTVCICSTCIIYVYRVIQHLEMKNLVHPVHPFGPFQERQAVATAFFTV